MGTGHPTWEIRGMPRETEGLDHNHSVGSESPKKYWTLIPHLKLYPTSMPPISSNDLKYSFLKIHQTYLNV